MTHARQTWVRPTPYPFSAGELARRTDPVGYRQGVLAGHEDALAHLRPLIADAWHDLSALRRLRDHCHREDPARSTWERCAIGCAAHLAGLLAVCRALKGTHR